LPGDKGLYLQGLGNHDGLPDSLGHFSQGEEGNFIHSQGNGQFDQKQVICASARLWSSIP